MIILFYLYAFNKKAVMSVSTSTKLDKVFGALADPTRREILKKVKGEAITVVELASDFDMSLPAVSKHLKILDNAGLLKRTKKGRFIYCKYHPETLTAAIKWISEQNRFWKESFDSLENFLDHFDNKTKK
jgi:DNA-binding transcriptional ArsR family regulator